MCVRKLGYHTTGGINIGNSVFQAMIAGCDAIQVMLGPPQTYNLSKIPERELALYTNTKREHNLSVYVHAPYVLHAFCKPANKKKNDGTLQRHLSACSDLDVEGYVIHMGGTKWYEEEEYYDVARSMCEAISKYNHRTTILLENCANGNAMSGDLKVICKLIQTLRNEGYNIGLCLDTCHAWAWGYNMALEGTRKEMVEIVSSVLQLFHLNNITDTFEPGCRRDRHEQLGHGAIDEQVFQFFMHSFPDCPIILERDVELKGQMDLALVKLWDKIDCLTRPENASALPDPDNFSEREPE